MRSPSRPTLEELTAFTLAARHLNLSQAARETGVTPSAVSRQVARLERLLDQPLFVRDGRALALTAAGRQFHGRVAAALSEIDAACLELRVARHGARALQLASVPTFTTRWLLPRLPSFLRSHPEVTINFRPHLSGREPFPVDLDVAIRYGDGRWEGVDCHDLGAHRYVAIASPALCGGARLRSPADAVRAPLLHHVQAEGAWQRWAQVHRVQGLAACKGPRFEQYTVLIQAVVSGLGQALVPSLLVEPELAAGTLVMPFDAPVDLEQGHHLCLQREALDAPAVRAFRDWLLASAAATE